MPSHIEKAEVFAKEISQYHHVEQVEMFRVIRERMLNNRQNDVNGMKCKHEELAADIDSHNEGSKIISSGL